jgi:hypothetical protein
MPAPASAVVLRTSHLLASRQTESKAVLSLQAIAGEYWIKRTTQAKEGNGAVFGGSQQGLSFFVWYWNGVMSSTGTKVKKTTKEESVKRRRKG